METTRHEFNRLQTENCYGRRNGVNRFLIHFESFNQKVFRKIPKPVGLLYVGQCQAPFGRMKSTKGIRHLDNKIVECKYEREVKEWIFMRERTDKSFPNSINTAQGRCFYFLLNIF